MDPGTGSCRPTQASVGQLWDDDLGDLHPSAGKTPYNYDGGFPKPAALILCCFCLDHRQRARKRRLPVSYRV